MFRQLVTPGFPGGPITPKVQNNIDSLFTYHPLQISALVETVWLNRYHAIPSAISSPFVPWSRDLSWQILRSDFFTGYDWSSGSPVPLDSTHLYAPAPLASSSFTPPYNQPGLGFAPTVPSLQPPIPKHGTNWDHGIYAYVIENTRIYEIFRKVLHKYIHGGELESPSPAAQLFWRNLEFLIYGEATPSMVWTTSGRLRRDEQAERCSTYFWMFGIDLSHAAQIAVEHPYEKPVASNRDFIPIFEAFGREVWRGIVNAKNTSGANDTDPNVIALLAERVYDMMQTQRLNGNQSREEFRAVAIMSFMHLAVLYDSPMVHDLRAEASDPASRLEKIAERVGMTAHPRSKALFDLAGKFSFLLQSIETGKFNDAAIAQLLYSQSPGNFVSQNAEDVIDQYSLATGRDLKSSPVHMVQQAKTSSLPLPKRQSPPAHLTAQRPNGRGTHPQ
jgi:hypothetical protein